MQGMLPYLYLLLAAWLPPQTIETKHFRFHYVTQARAEAETLAGRAEDILLRIVSDLGREPQGKITVVVVARREEFQRAQPGGRKMPGWVAGVAYPRKNLIVLGPAPPGAPPIGREVLFAHELSHVALAHAVGFRRLPTWFVEGFADLQAMAPHVGDWRDISTKGALRLSELHQGLGHDGRRAHQSYRQSYDFVRFLVGHGDATDFRTFIAKLAKGVAFQDALREVYRVSSHDLESQWRRRWNWQNVVVPMVTSGVFLWVLAALLLVLGFVRKRRIIREAIASMDGDQMEVLRPPKGLSVLTGSAGERGPEGVIGQGRGPGEDPGGDSGEPDGVEPWRLPASEKDGDPAREEHPLLNMGVALVATLAVVTLTAILASIWPGTRLWILAAPAVLLTFVALRWASGPGRE